MGRSVRSYICAGLLSILSGARNIDPYILAISHGSNDTLFYLALDTLRVDNLAITVFRLDILGPYC